MLSTPCWARNAGGSVSTATGAMSRPRPCPRQDRSYPVTLEEEHAAEHFLHRLRVRPSSCSTSSVARNHMASVFIYYILCASLRSVDPNQPRVWSPSMLVLVLPVHHGNTPNSLHACSCGACDLHNVLKMRCLIVRQQYFPRWIWCERVTA